MATNKTCAELIATIRARAGRSNDSVVITTAFVLDALNEAMLHIVRKSPGLIDLVTEDVTTFTIATDDTTVDISSLDPAHIDKIWILNGEDTRRKGLEFMPKDEFFRRFINIADESEQEPWIYTRYGKTLYFNCPVSSDYNGLNLRIDYTKWATVFPDVASTNTSDLLNSDKGLIHFALAEIFDTLALSVPRLETKALKTRIMFNAWLEEYQDYNDVQTETLYEEL